MALFLVLLFALASILPSVPAQHISPPHTFVVVWGPSVCRDSSQRGCNGTKIPTEFTIQGLLPGSEPSAGTNCTVSLHLNHLTPLTRLQLGIVWPDVTNFGVDNPSSFNFNVWANAWTRYGCFTGLTPHEYFQMALNLYTAMGPLREDISSGSTCSPGYRCDLDQLLNDYDTKYPNRLPSIVCTSRRFTSSRQIQEFRFRISAAGEFIPGDGLRTLQCTIFWPSDFSVNVKSVGAL